MISSNQDTSPIRILLVDDHPIVRQGLRLTFSIVPDIEVVAEAETGMEVVSLVEQHAPDIIVLDLEMPRMDGVTVLTQLRSVASPPRVLVLTSYATEKYITSALNEDVNGFHMKDSKPETLIEAIRAIYRGENSLHPVIMKALLREFRQPSKLSLREQTILQLLGDGLSNTEIAEQLDITTRTVSSSIRVIADNLQLKNRTQVALYARR